MSSSPSYPVQNDDFKRIRGIGPGIERRLYSSHIRTYAQLASLTPEDLANNLHGIAGLSSKRIAQQDWIGQARLLAGEQNVKQADKWAETSFEPILSEQNAGSFDKEIAKESLVSEKIIPQRSMHYVTFTVELLLDENNNVRRTKVIHVQEGFENTWPGWEDKKLIDFIEEHAGLNLPVQPEIVSLPSQNTESDYRSSLQPEAKMGTNVTIKEINLTTRESSYPTRILNSFQPFHIHLSLDLSKIDAPAGTTLNYSVDVFAKNLSMGTKLVVGSEQGKLLLAEDASIKIDGQPLRPGPYRLETAVKLTQHPGVVSWPQLMAFLDGGGFQVY
jgi:hypothetical protein